MADERLEQGGLARSVRADERDVLPSLDHERAAFDQLLAARRQTEPVDVDHGPARARRLEELEAERAPPPRQVLQLPGCLAALLLEAGDLRDLGLSLLRLRLLVPEPLHEPLQTLDVVADALDRLRGGLCACSSLDAPLMPRPGERQSPAALELENRQS